MERTKRSETRNLTKRTFIALFAFAALLGAAAQGKSASIQLVGYVPAMLRVSLDFSPDGTAQITGYLPGKGPSYLEASYSPRSGSGFEIRTGATVELGNATLFSNVLSSYTVNVYSANGGTLRDPSGEKSVGIPYQLQLGNATAIARGGEFSFRAAGKSSKYGDSVRVALTIRDVPQSAASGYYSDSLMFAISAN